MLSYQDFGLYLLIVICLYCGGVSSFGDNYVPTQESSDGGKITPSIKSLPAYATRRAIASGFFLGINFVPSRAVRDVTPTMMIPPQPWEYITTDTCLAFLKGIGKDVGPEGWCPGVTDEVLCWPPAAPGYTVSQLCPRMQGVDTTKSAQKSCLEDGTWYRRSDINGPEGYTDYEDCFNEDTKVLFETFLGNSTDTGDRFGVLYRARAIEMAGFPLSLVCVLVSLFIFRYFRSLRCARTTIHVHLFSAIAIMTACKTIEISDQFISGYAKQTHVKDSSSLRTTSHLCELLVVMIEYSRTAMFMWMFLEGLYMHNVVAWKVFQASKPNYWLYCAVGWGFPALLVSAWAPVLEFVWKRNKMMSQNRTNEDHCWYQHNDSKWWYIIEAPRVTFIAINLFFLINIIRVLLTKLRDSHQSDTVQIRKAVKATIVLAPLLGITHLIWVLPPPISIGYAYALYVCWMYISHFLRSFEGIFVCLVYCFLNGEVQAAIKTSCERRAVLRETNRSAQARRVSSLSSSHLTRYMQVNRESVQSSVGSSNTNKRATTNRILKLLNCWPTSRPVANGGGVRNSRSHSYVPTYVPPDGTTIQLQINETIKEEKEENIEM